MNDAPILLDGAVNAALLRALAKDPKARFGSCEEFVESCLAQSPRSPQRESRTEEQRPGASNPEGPQVPKTAAALESDILRRKLAFAREQAERKAKEEAERVARERAESELKAKKEGGRAVPASRRGEADSSPPWERTAVWRPPPLWPAPARSSASGRRRSPCAGVRRDRS